MTRQECAQVIAVLRSVYPDQVIADPKALVAAWEMAMGDVPYAAVNEAIRRYVRTAKWMPKPSEIRELVAEAYGVAPDEGTAWGLVLRHMREHGYLNPPAFTGPAPVAAAVAAIGGWHRLRTSTDAEADRAAFGRAYAATRSRALADMDLGVELAKVDGAALPERVTRLRAVGE